MSVSFTGAYSQDFNTLPTSGTSLAWTNDSTLAGWSLFRQPAPGTAITAINASDGSSNTGSFDSFGVAGTNPLTDRALGGVGASGAYFGSPATGTMAGWMAVALMNGTASTINTLDLSYTGEQWRDGGNTTAQMMALEYGFGGSFASVSTWTAPGNSFNFTSPKHTATAAALDGNLAANRTTDVGGTLFNLSWTAGSTLWVRWLENNDVGNDHGLAIDDVSVNVSVVNESLIVDTLVDELDANHSPGNLSLREAITLANGSVGANTITFAPSLTNGGAATILLRLGELTVLDSVTIIGPGTNLLTIDASGNDPTPTVNNGDGSRVFTVNDGNSTVVLTVSISGLVLTGGDVGNSSPLGGGAVLNSENLTISASSISGNSASNITNGGGACNLGGTLTINTTTISGNVAAYGGGVYGLNGTVTLSGSTINANVSDYGRGGGIRVDAGTLTVTNCTITGNNAAITGGGMYSRNSNVLLANSMLIDNSSRYGGGLCFDGGNLTITGATIAGNHSSDGGGICTFGGALTVNSSTISGNQALGYQNPLSGLFFKGRGGGIFQGGGTLSITASTIATSYASGNGGGIYSFNGLSVTSSTISGNSAQRGGGIHNNGGLTMNSSAITGNTAYQDGGGIFNAAGNAALIDSTISSNSADYYGGGVLVAGGNLTAANSTITGNRADSSAGLAGDGGGIRVSGTGVAHLDDAIVAGNLRAVATRDDIHGPVTARFSLVGDSTGATITNNGGNLIGTSASPINPLFGPLANNGGPTRTHTLLVGSPAINMGDPAFMTPPIYDERGAPFARVSGGRIDIGALEVQASLPALPGDYNLNNVVDAADYVLWRKTRGQGGLTPYSGADGNGDGVINDADYGVWQMNFDKTAPPAAASGTVALASTAVELGAAIVSVSLETTPAPFVAKVNTAKEAVVAVFDNRAPRHDSASVPYEWINAIRFTESSGDNLLLLANDRARQFSQTEVDNYRSDEQHKEDVGSQRRADEALAETLAEWR